MRAFPPDATSWAPVRDRRHADTDLYSSGECDPPTPLQMFTRLGVLLRRGFDAYRRGAGEP